MVSEKKKIRRTVWVLIMMISGFIINPFNVLSVKADENGAQAVSAQDVINASLFLEYKKGEDDEHGKFIVSCWYIPTEYLISEFSYGVVIFPKLYMERFEVYDNFMENFTAQGKNFLDVKAPLENMPNGLCKCGIARILEKNTSLEFTFVLYVTDGNSTAYSEPHFGTYNNMRTREYTNTELMSIARRKLGMRDSFNEIIIKLNELIDAVWIYMVMGFTAIISVWGAVIGIKIAVARKNEEKINARGMLKSLVIGVVILFVISFALPLLIKGLANWTGAYIPETPDITG